MWGPSPQQIQGERKRLSTLFLPLIRPIWAESATNEHRGRSCLAEDAGNRVYDSVGTLLSKPRQSVVCSARTNKGRDTQGKERPLGGVLGSTVLSPWTEWWNSLFEGGFVPSKRRPAFSYKQIISPLLSGGASPSPNFKFQFIAHIPSWNGVRRGCTSPSEGSGTLPQIPIYLSPSCTKSKNYDFLQKVS